MVRTRLTMMMVLAVAGLGFRLEAHPPSRTATASPEGEALHPDTGSRVPVIQKGDGRLVFHPGGRLAAPAPDWAVQASLLLEIKPGANLAGRNLSFLDLSRKSLAGADLSGADLTGADLTGTDLRGADLSRARLNDVKANARTLLAGARLFMAEVRGARGLSLDKGLLHPFFSPETGVGMSLNEYALHDPAFHPDEIALGPKGDVLLMERGNPAILGISPTGAAMEAILASGRGAQAMAVDPKGQFWAVFGPIILNAPASVMEMGTRSTGLFERPVASEALGAAVSGLGTLWLSSPGELNGFTWKHSEQKLKGTPHAIPGMNLRSLAVTPDGRDVFGIDPETGVVAYLRRGATDLQSIVLPPDWRAGSAVLGTNRRLWISQLGGMGLACFHISPTAPRLELRSGMPMAGSGCPRIQHLALGADGRMWFTQQNPAAIGHFDQDTLKGVGFPLPDGMLPERLVVAPDGAVFFTAKGRASLWCLRERKAEDKDPALLPVNSSSSSSSSWELPVYQPRPGRLPARERRERALAIPVAAEEGDEPGLPLEGPAPRAESKTVAAVARQAGPAPGKAPLEVLDDLGLYLDEGRVAHILGRHRFNLDNTRGQFNAAFSTPEGLLALLAEAATRAAGVANVVRRFDPMGIRHTPCTLDEDLGWYYSPKSGDWQPTRCLDIVTREVELEDGTRAQVVLSAYPISPNRF